jgi:hypothetical protein
VVREDQIHVIVREKLGRVIRAEAGTELVDSKMDIKVDTKVDIEITQQIGKAIKKHKKYNN